MWRVEPICEAISGWYGLPISKSGYYAFKKRPKSARQIEDERLAALISEIHLDNYSCYGVEKVWHTLLNQGERPARCTVARLMHALGLRGACRGKVKRTTIAGKAQITTDDLVHRVFTADAPDRLWVADFTYVSTWEGWCYTAFVTDVFARRIIGWDVSTRMDESLVERAFRMAVYTRLGEGVYGLEGLIHHSDKGSQYTADDFAKALAAFGIKASIGTVGDSFDNALAETENGQYKTELVKLHGPWTCYEDLNIETARWVDWHNSQCISKRNGFLSPIDVERKWYDDGTDLRNLSKKR